MYRKVTPSTQYRVYVRKPGSMGWKLQWTFDTAGQMKAELAKYSDPFISNLLVQKQVKKSKNAQSFTHNLDAAKISEWVRGKITLSSVPVK